jgi:hypothetical protein
MKKATPLNLPPSVNWLVINQHYKQLETPEANLKRAIQAVQTPRKTPANQLR